MAEISAKVAWALSKAIKRASGNDKPDGKVVKVATVIRKDTDGTVWIRMAGSDIDTPVNGSITTSVNPGDVVQCRVDGTVLSLTGNVTDPAVGASKVTNVANTIVDAARETLSSSIQSAQKVAEAAQKVADAVNQHFFSDTNGIHVTSATQDEWDAQHTGPNVLINSIGQLFRDGLNNLLTLTTENGARALTIWDGLGNTASNVLATFSANGISFADGTSFGIGDSSAYIDFDGNGHISIGGSGLTIGGYIPTGGVTVSDLTQAAQAATLNSNISVGGRNLLPTSLVNSNVRSGVTVSGITIVLEDDGWFRVSGSKSGNSAIGLWSDSDYATPAVPQLDYVSGKTLTWTIETEGTPFVTGSTYDTSTHIVAYGTSSSNAHRFGGAFDLVRTVTPQVTHYGEIRYYIGENVPNGTTVDGRFRIMAEFGNVSTAWTYAPEDAVTFVDVGGRNLLRSTGNLAASDLALTRATVTDGIITITPTTSAGYAKFKVDYLDFNDFGSGEYTLSFDAKAVSGATYTQLKGPMFYSGFNIPSRAGNIFSSSYDRYTSFTLSPTLTNEWVRFSQTFTVPDDLTTGQTSALASGSNLTVQFAMTGSYAPMMVRNVKLEKGNKSTDWTAAPEDVQAAVSEAAKTATNYITADSTGIKIHMSGSSTTYQHQSSTATTYYVSGNKRAEVSANGLEVFDGTYGSEESVAAFGTVARLGKATGNKVIADSTGVHIYNVQGSQVAAFGQALGELTTTMLSDEPEIGTNYPVPSDAISDISIMLDDQTLVEDTDYTLSSGIVTLLESTTVTSILDDSGSSGEESSEDVEAHSLTCEYRASAGVGLAIGASVTRPGLDVAERAVFRHPSFVEASHGTANADTGFRASRTDTGIQVFCGIGIGGVNHGVYSHVLNRWLINADRSTVHVAPHEVTDGNINIKSKYVYATTPSASNGDGWGHGLQYLDTAGALAGVVKAYSLTTGEKGIQLSATRKVGSTTVNNGVMLGVDSSGNRKLTFNGGGRALWRQALGFDSGYVGYSYGGSDNAPNNAYRDIPITFNFTHTYAPHVVATFATGSTGVTMGGLSLSVLDITTTGCKVRIYNNTSDARNPALEWVAID